MDYKELVFKTCLEKIKNKFDNKIVSFTFKFEESLFTFNCKLDNDKEYEILYYSGGVPGHNYDLYFINDENNNLEQI